MILHVKNKTILYYDEYGAGAYIRYAKSGGIFADFPNHLNAESFLKEDCTLFTGFFEEEFYFNGRIVKGM